jgi:hypothetical protein
METGKDSGTTTMRQTIRQRKMVKEMAKQIKCVDAVATVTTDLSDKEANHISRIMQYLWHWKKRNGVADLVQANKHLEKLITLLKGNKNA